MKNDTFYCTHCGRKLDKNYKNGLCNKHYMQKEKYGEFLDDTQRCEEDPNEIIIKDNHAEIVLYDLLFEEKDRVIIDKEDVDKVKDFYWKSKQSCITSQLHGETILLANYLLDTNNKIDYINKNYLDCRKENLKVIEKKNKKNKNPYVISKKNKNKIIVEFVGKSHEGVVGSSLLISYPKKDGEYGKILIEMGMVQKNGALYDEYKVNKEVVEGVANCGEVEACFISHPHL